MRFEDKRAVIAFLKSVPVISCSQSESAAQTAPAKRRCCWRRTERCAQQKQHRALWRAAERLCVLFPHPCSSASRCSPGTAPPPARHDADQNHLLFALSEKIARQAQGWLLSTDRDIAGFQERTRHTVWPPRWGLASLAQGTGQSARCLLPVGRHRQKAKNHLT